MYTETHRTTGDGYSVAIYRIGEQGSGEYAVQECASAFLPSPTKRLELGPLTYQQACDLRDAWVSEGRRTAHRREVERLQAAGTAVWIMA